MTTASCRHRPDVGLSYLAWNADARRRHVKGERQRRCPACKLYVWESLYKRKDKRDRSK